ncbi:S-adenosylmethionine sensor upstream of mTORC1 [Cimex lectularius]|uniref:S-adenosylmethionine sensor upstream of mTORC1 n=1 Tax=Cimex lectularius TaxID=79782 RepID=A0A8I6SCZ6_CIMLE|nr:S-adenosylmethionine sensor upstream of mTORC1 [Cimex lectularius]
MSNQQELSGYIKNVHINLRLIARKIGAEAAWEQHCKNEDTLEKYALAMKDLATKHWEKNNGQDPKLNGVYWIREQCKLYFFEKGQDIVREKEIKMELKFFNRKSECETKNKVNVIKLLDVGSCYNPFKKFPFFDVTALDLAPACEDVLKCDFLKLDIDQCTFLSESYFHVVVFSLLLEYLPDAKQRYLCCEKAYKLLTPGGLLIIITPDSKHETANSKIMKSWRKSLAHLGFLRITYEKLKHLHCMIFVKCINPLVPRHWCDLQGVIESPQELLRIPQDETTYEELEEKHEFKYERSESDNNKLAETFSFLAGDY